MVHLPPPSFEAVYRAHAFPSGILSGHNKVSFTSDDLAHALLTTGRAPGDLYSHGAASAYEWLHRVSLLPAYVRRSYTGRLTRSRLATQLDRSELVGLSYALGQAVTAVFCRLELSVSHLLHVDRYANHYGLAFSGRKRADLFGCAPGGWVVAEAKGRSRSIDAELRSNVLAQKRSVSTVGGQTPWMAVGCAASFPASAGGLEIDVFDPETVEPDAVAIPASRDRFMLAYYLPFAVTILAGEAADEDETVGASFPAYGLRVAMLPGIYDRVMVRASTRQFEGFAAEVSEILENVAFDYLNLLPDGTAVTTQWADIISAPE